MVFAGKFAFYLPPNKVTTVTNGGCIASSNYTLFAVWPHMHQLATHQKVERIRGGNSLVIHDKAFAFAEQQYYPQTPEIQVQSGDRINVECTYNNTTSSGVLFGDSSTAEMCFSGLYRYPAANAGKFQCTDQPNF